MDINLLTFIDKNFLKYLNYIEVQEVVSWFLRICYIQF